MSNLRCVYSGTPTTEGGVSMLSGALMTQPWLGRVFITTLAAAVP